MADKHTSERDSDARRDVPASRQADPDDDVTSELSGLIARAFGSDDGLRNSEARVTSSSLVSHGDADGNDTLEPGFLLSGRYEIVERVHSGGMSHVYKAIDRRRHPGHSRQIHVAVKMLRRAVSDRDEYRLLLEKEASKARSLSHPNIIKIFDFDAHDGQFFLVMEWLQGESLKTLLKRAGGEPLSPTFSWAVIEAVADALQHSHSNGVIHADINPSNIFVTTTHDIKLLDFGVARLADDEDNAPEDLTAWVTPSYASPQVLSGLSPVIQDDLFSLACVAYRCFAGTHPFDGKLSIVAQREDVVVRPVAVVSEQEWTTLDRCLAYTRAERPDSASVLLRSHATASGGESAEANSRPWPWTVLAAAAIAAVLVVGWWSQFGSSPTDDTPATAADTGAASPADAGAAVEPTPPEPVTPVDSLLALARQAMADEQLIVPVNNNARDWYRRALAIDANNPEALAGLRAISDVSVTEARSAIEAGDPQAAASALAAAAETDAGNPAIAMLEELLVTRGNAQLTAARLAAASGNEEQAEAALARAEQYAHIETEAIESIRSQLTALSRSEALRSELAVVDAHIAAGRLLRPAGDNAYDTLVPLRDAYGAEPQLTAASQRLAERLLTRAALASASADLADADALVSAAASLGVLDEEVERVRAVMAAAATTSDAASPAPADVATEPAGAAPAEVETSVSFDSISDATDEALAVEGSTESAAPADVDIATQSPATAVTDGAEVNDDAGIEAGSAGDIPSPPTENGERPADVNAAVVAALPAATTRGLVTEAEIPLTGSEPGPGPPASGGRQVSMPGQAVAETGSAEAPAAATDDSAAQESEQSMAMQLRSLGLTRYAAPQYPRGAKRRGVSGYVEVAFNVTPDGQTEAIEVLRGEPAGVFERSATRAIRQWQFAPRDETIRGNITLRFEIEQ